MRPGEFYNLPHGERLLITAFALRELEDEKKASWARRKG
jgi:hypothetical protein